MKSAYSHEKLQVSYRDFEFSAVNLKHFHVNHIPNGDDAFHHVPENGNHQECKKALDYVPFSMTSIFISCTPLDIYELTCMFTSH